MTYDPAWPIKRLPLGSQRFLCDPFFELESDGITITKPELSKYIQQLPHPAFPDASYVVSVGFHTAHFSWVSKDYAHFDTHKAERWALSDASFDAIFKARQQYQMAFVKEMQRLVPALVIVEAPRLFRDSDYVKDRNIETIRYIDDRVRDQFAAFLEDQGIPLVRLKPEMIAADGFMSPVYRNKTEGDQHHASPQLGEELAPLIFDSLAEQRTGARNDQH